MDATEVLAWDRASKGEEADRIRLADQVGCTDLRERADETLLRPVAIRAMAYCGDFSELGWLASTAAAGADDDADAALESIHALASDRRMAVDPEEGGELAAGCRVLLALAREEGQPRKRRAMAVESLRMLAERGCVKPAEIPTDVDLPDASP